MKLKFQIRDLLWLMVVVACCALWWRDRLLLRSLLAERQQQADQTKAMMDFLNQSLLSVSPPPTPPQTPIDEAPVVPDEALDSDGAPVELPDEVRLLDLSDALFPTPNRAGEDGSISPSQADLFGVISPRRNELWNGPVFPLLFNGTDAELREHLGQAKR